MSDIEDVMIDFETLATTSDAVILSAAFVEFERYPAKGEWGGCRGEELFFDIGWQQALGRRVCPDTEQWWEKQNPPQSLFEGEARPEDLVTRAQYYIQDGVRVWAQGSDFDLTLARDAASACELEFPGKYWNSRDARTFVEESGPFVGLNGYDLRKLRKKRGGQEHDALQDARWQVINVQRIFTRLAVMQDIFGGYGHKHTDWWEEHVA